MGILHPSAASPAGAHLPPAAIFVGSLGVLALSDSLASMWPRLASNGGLELVMVEDPSRLNEPTHAAALIAAAGEEDRAEQILLDRGAPATDVAVVGTSTDRRAIVRLLRAGACDYFAIPGDEDVLAAWVHERAGRAVDRERRDGFAAAQRAQYQFTGILGKSEVLLTALERAARVIPHADVTILLTGETGTGKELLARAIHYNGPRRDAPFVDINCAAIPDQLLESELFGHEKGAFTGASGAKPGLFEVAHRGTLFLDEIAQLALPLQGKLLRALETREVRRLGGTRTTRVDVRILAATHVDLAAAVHRGQFREDLYYRLSVVPIELPPLRARRGDIPLLAEHFLGTFAKHYHIAPRTLSRDAVETLREYPWPGNVRELRNAMERALLLGAAPTLHATDIVLLPAPGAEPLHPAGLTFPATADGLLRSAAHAMVELYDGNKTAAARRLDISRTRLLRLLDAPPTQSDEHTALADTDGAQENGL